MRSTFLPALVLLCNVLFAQTTCEVWQWTGTDSTKKILAKTEKYDSRGQLIYERFNGFLYEAGPYIQENEQFYQYSDTLRTKTIFVSPAGDSMSIISEYNANGKVVRETEFRRRYVLQDTVKSGMFTIDMVLTDSTDGKWVLMSVWNYAYDTKGRISSVEISRSGSDAKDSSKFEYDEELGRTSRYEYVMQSKPRYNDVFVYYDGGYRVDRTWYDEEGKLVSKPGKRDPKFMRAQVHMYKLDAQGRIIEERTEDRKGKLIERVVTAYNTDGKIARESFYDEKDKVALTHVYVYK